MKRFILVLAFAFFAIYGVSTLLAEEGAPEGDGTASDGDGTTDDNETAAPDEAALMIWSQKCANCHGDDGVGKTKMGKRMAIEDMTTAEWHTKRPDDEALRTVIDKGLDRTTADGVGQMMDPSGLTPEETDKIIALIRSFKPAAP